MYGQAGLRPRGDVNCDWAVNIADINAVVDSIISGAEYHPFYGYAADINADTEINIAKALDSTTNAYKGFIYIAITHVAYTVSR